MNDLPPGWESRPLGDLLQAIGRGQVLQQGWSPQCLPHPRREASAWGVLKTTAVQVDGFRPHEHKELPGDLAPRPDLQVRVGDLLLTCAGPRARCGVPSLVTTSDERLLISGKMYRFRPRPDLVYARYLFLYLTSADAQRRIEAMKTGISDSGLNLTKAKFAALPVPVPPLDEQHRIVAVLENHLSRLAAGADYLTAAALRLGRLRAPLPDAPAVRLGDLVTDMRYGTSEKCSYEGPGRPVLRIPNVAAGQLDYSDLKRANRRGADLSSYELTRGDVLVIRSNGSLGLVGRMACASTDLPAGTAFASYLIRIRLDEQRIEPRWLVAMSGSACVRRQVAAAASSSAGQHNINKGQLEGLRIPLPSLATQKTWLASNDELLEEASRLGAAIRRERDRTDRLRREVLSAALRR